MKKSSVKFIAAAVFGAVLFAGCGGGDERESSDNTNGSGAVETEEPSEGAAIKVEAKEFSFTPADLEVTADTPFTVEVTNVGAIEHNFVIEGYEDSEIKTTPGKTVTGEYTLPAGNYKIYCSIAGHEAAGMVGTLTVS